MGKSIDKRLAELGGQRAHPLCCADEATGLEETVEVWKKDIMKVLKNIDESDSASAEVKDGESTTSTTVDQTIPTLLDNVVTEKTEITHDIGASTIA